MLNQQNSVDPSPLVDVAIKSTVRHPKNPYAEFRNDIALVELESFVKFNDKIRQACLNYDASNKQRELTNIGWGQVSIHGERKETKVIGSMIL